MALPGACRRGGGRRYVCQSRAITPVPCRGNMAEKRCRGRYVRQGRAITRLPYTGAGACVVGFWQPVDTSPCRRCVERVAGHCASRRGGFALYVVPRGRMRALVMRFFPPAAALCGHGEPPPPAPCPLAYVARYSCRHGICTDRPATAAYIGTAAPCDYGRHK
jgi:hypothetical protein